MEMPGIEPGAFHMQSERSTTELHPRPEFRIESKKVEKGEQNSLNASLCVSDPTLF